MIYFVTNRHLNKRSYYRIIEEACQSGVDYLILREKDLGYREYLEISEKVKLITDKYKVPLIVNGNIEVCRRLEAYGYHCGYREFMELGKLYSYQGVSVHSIEEAIEASEAGANYILVGHIYKTKSKEGLEPRGLDFLDQIRKAVSTKVVAIGGINHKNINEVRSLKIHGIALMSYIMESSNLLDSMVLIGNCETISLK